MVKRYRMPGGLAGKKMVKNGLEIIHEPVYVRITLCETAWVWVCVIAYRHVTGKRDNGRCISLLNHRH